MNRYERSHRPAISTKAIAGGLIALLGVGMLIGQSFKPESTNQLQQLKEVKNESR